MTMTSDCDVRFEERLRRELLAVYAEGFGDAGPDLSTSSPRRKARRAGRPLVAAAAVIVIAGASILALSLGPEMKSIRLDAALIVQRTQIAVADAIVAGDIGYDHMVTTENRSGAVAVFDRRLGLQFRRADRDVQRRRSAGVGGMARRDQRGLGHGSGQLPG
jgi:hypothetical protein